MFLRKVLPTLSLLVSLALPARAMTWMIGPTIGLDILSSNGRTAAVVGAPIGNEFSAVGTHPGLRIGAWDGSQHHAVFSDLSAMSYSASGFDIHAAAFTINYAYAFTPGSSPYVTAGVGFSNIGDSNSSTNLTLYGAGLGMRQRLGHGHGGIRVEARYDRATAPSRYASDLNVLGVRVGFDLDLN